MGQWRKLVDVYALSQLLASLFVPHPSGNDKDFHLVAGIVVY